MKSDREVLAETIETLEQEGVWCKKSWSHRNFNVPGGMNLCLEGALMKALGMSWDYTNGSWTRRTSILFNEFVNGNNEQYNRISYKIADHVHRWAPRHFNDDESTTKEDVILALKEVMDNEE